MRIDRDIERGRRALLAIALCASACGGPQRRPRTPGCSDHTEAHDSLRLVPNRLAEIAQPCPEYGDSYIASPIRLTAALDGLHVQFEVNDPSFVPGTLRLERGQRDVVVIFPNGESPGRPAIELAVEGTSRGYRVDDVVPWESWRLHGPDGEFRFLVAVYDREATGAENETRVALHIRVEPATP